MQRWVLKSSSLQKACIIIERVKYVIQLAWYNVLSVFVDDGVDNNGDTKGDIQGWSECFLEDEIHKLKHEYRKASAWMEQGQTGHGLRRNSLKAMNEIMEHVVYNNFLDPEDPLKRKWKPWTHFPKHTYTSIFTQNFIKFCAFFETFREHL